MLPVAVSPKHKAVGVPYAESIRNLFPAAPSVTIGGNEHIILPHKPTETFMLRKLGYDVPSPILSHYDWCGGSPFHAQKMTCGLLTTERRAYVLNGMGCVDADTEYLSETGWKRIADYTGGRVAQYLPEPGAIEFVEPSQYVKLPCAEMIRFKTTRGVDQLLSPEHRVLLADGRVLQAEDIEATYGSRTSKEFKFRTTYVVTGTKGINLSDADIRLQVALNADGHQPAQRIYVRLKKARKISRFRQLVIATGRSFKERFEPNTGYTVFSLLPPRAKGFGASWWAATQHQLELVADEVTHWDGSFRKAGGLAFSSYCQADADFIQYAYSASGKRASLAVRQRARRGRLETDYCVHASGTRPPEIGLYGTSNGKVRQNVWREPSPDGFKYCFMVPSTFLLLRRNGCIFATGNTGKTKAALWAWDYLNTEGLCKKALVSAPLSTLNFTWAREVLNTVPHRKVAILHGTKQQRLDKLNDPDVDIFVINHDGHKVILKELLAKGMLQTLGINVLIIDELAVFRNGGSQRTKGMQKLCEQMEWVWGMTGSPIPNCPTDSWAQARLITPSNVPKYFNRFRDELMKKVSNFRYIPKPDAVERAYNVLQPAVRFTLDDVVELPECVERTIDVDMGPTQAKIYKQLMEKCHAAVASQEITAANAGAVMMKLLQVSTGWVYSSDKGVVPLDNVKRIEALMDAINATDRKVLVFAPFKHALDGISEALTSEGIEHAVVSGDTPMRERSEIFNLFQNTSKYRVILAHPQCLAHGITLTAADTIIWYAPVTSLEIYDQANHRIRRVGQKHKQLVLHLQSTPVERKIYKMLQAKQNVQDKLLQMFEDDSRQEYGAAA